jgi:hypothetical protein
MIGCPASIQSSHWKNMSTLEKYTPHIYALLILATSSISVVIIIENQHSGIYNAEHDSIAIPIASTIATCLALPTMLLLQLPHHIKNKKGHPTEIPLKILALLAAGISLIILIGSVSYWYIPNHITIVILYTTTTLASLIFQIQIFKKPTQRLPQINKALKH